MKRNKYYAALMLVLTAVVSCQNENIPPTCDIISPLNGTDYEIGDIITISLEAEDEDGSVSEVKFYIDDIGVSSLGSFPYNYDWNTSEEEEGIKTIKVSAKDDQGAIAEDEIAVLLNLSEEGTGSFTDTRDMRSYKTVTIGTQTWMAENLAYLPSVVGSATNSYTDPYHYVYGYNGTSVDDAIASSNYQTYGVLYNFPAAEEACPSGWHLPTVEEWTTLTDYLGGIDVAGCQLKEAGKTHWLDPNYCATNETGFTALPGGERGEEAASDFGWMGKTGNWWSTESYSENGAYAWGMAYHYGRAGKFYYGKRAAFSVRCVKD